MLNHMEREKEVCDFVTDLTGVPIADVKSPSRSKHKVEARALYSYVLRSFGWSFQEIATHLARDHSTIIHLVNLFKKNTFKGRVDELAKMRWPEDFPEENGGNPQD